MTLACSLRRTACCALIFSVTSVMMPRRPTPTPAASHRCGLVLGDSSSSVPFASTSFRRRSCIWERDRAFLATAAFRLLSRNLHSPRNFQTRRSRWQPAQQRTNLRRQRAVLHGGAVRGGGDRAADRLVQEPGEGGQRPAAALLPVLVLCGRSGGDAKGWCEKAPSEGLQCSAASGLPAALQAPIELHATVSPPPSPDR
jgi:hypothetical protein